jgi:hypothetical protein
MAILLRLFQLLARRIWLYCLGPLCFLIIDYDYIVYTLSVACPLTITVLLRPFQFLASRLYLYCLGPFSVLLADYDYIA